MNIPSDPQQRRLEKIENRLLDQELAHADVARFMQRQSKINIGILVVFITLLIANALQSVQNALVSDAPKKPRAVPSVPAFPHLGGH